jgi:NAD(P)-dependent dehydrogenase (short-subunit alcohol dehydrogenase family)
VWLGLRAAIEPMRRRGGGSVVITSSIQGASALPGTSAYTTSKHAVIGMMKGAALELAKDRIRVNCVIPGMTDTPMMDRIHESSGAPEQMAAVVRATIPMRRYARAEEIAGLMLFLASDESSYCTGSTYAADGGILASWQSTPD